MRQEDLTYFKENFLSQRVRRFEGKKGEKITATPSEGVGVTVLWSCRPNGWPKKNPFRRGHLRQGDLTYVPHKKKREHSL